MPGRIENGPKRNQVNQIGEGMQGTIFEQVGQDVVMKKEKPGNEALLSDLRNFPLSLRSMEEAGVDVEELRTSMGKAYALMHWGACFNGDDVEFVLGTQKVDIPRHLQAEGSEVEHFVTTLYLLDFEQCEAVDLSQDKEIVYQIFKGTMVTGDNKDFIPRLTESTELFETFITAYMETGDTILVKKHLQDKFNTDEFLAEYVEYFEDLFTLEGLG
ncbi:Fc.00g012000.m01.CDS01 [Cosmosporella sp. VM-42]